MEKDSEAAFNFKFTNCLIKFDDPNNNFVGEQYNFANAALYENVIFNEDPGFLDPLLNKLQIENGSIADGKGILAGSLFNDLLNISRGTPPDLGAYESIIFPVED